MENRCITIRIAKDVGTSVVNDINNDSDCVQRVTIADEIYHPNGNC